jgi:ParB/RepB/Spo0J family partition protein
MSETIEISELDTRYERYRLASAGAEKMLLFSIRSYGIRDPLQGVDVNRKHLLLDGFKRYRCAKALHIATVPYRSIGNDEVAGILELIRVSNAKSLTIIEQARLIEELCSVYKMSNDDIARQLEKSKSWVSMRAGLLREVSDVVLEKLFNGEFPTYAYMYTLRQFMRMNSTPRKDIDEFVTSVAGRQLSIRDIEVLAHGYFKGGEDIRQQIRQGNISWSLSRMKENGRSKQSDCSEFEQTLLRDLEITQKYMQRVACKSKAQQFKTNSFFAQANLLAGGIIRQLDSFNQAIREFYDTTGKKGGNLQSP